MDSANKKYVSGAGILIVSLMIGNLLNFLYNAFLGRALSFEDYAVITLVGNLWLILSVVVNALMATVNHETAYISAKSGKESTIKFFKNVQKKSLIYSSISIVLWILLIPLLALFFNVSDWTIFILFSPSIVLGTLAAVNRGFLQGNLFFIFFAIITIVEALSKLLISIFFVLINQNHLAYLSLPISIAISFIVSISFIFKVRIKDTKEDYINFPKNFMFAAILNGISATAFLTIDVLMAKHFLNDIEAGQYALLSLVGKMIYFFGSLLTTLMITVISRSEGENKNSNAYFYKFFTAAAFFCICGFVVLGPLGKMVVPILFGDKAKDIFPYLTTYTLAIVLFTLANTIIIFHLAKKQYIFPILGVIISALMAIGIMLYHGTIFQIVYVVLAFSFVSFILMSILHFLHDQGRFIFRNLMDFYDLFVPLKQSQDKKDGKKKILIFNWRDTKHKYAGGAEVYVHELAKRWVEDGNTVMLFCGNDSKSPREEIIDGVEIVRRGGFYFVYVWAFFYYLFKFRGKYDVILDCQNGIPFFTPLYAKEKVFCLVFHIHQEVFKNYLPKPLAWLAKNLEKKVMPYAYRHSKYITISESTRKDMEDMGLLDTEIEIIYPGVDLHNLKPLKKNKEPMVLYLGRLKSYKSVDVLIKAFEIILKRIPSAKLVIAGSGDEEQNLKKLAKELNLMEKIEFKGKVSEKEKIELMQKAWVFVNPSFMEGWGITTIEANACGAPVVASDVPGLRDSVKAPHAGFLVKHGDHEEFANIISKILNEDTLREKMSKEAHIWAQNFDWYKSSVKLISLF